VLAFSPFNFPLNLALHKLVPAWVAGCPVVLKPSPQTPLTALLLADVFEKYAKQSIHDSMLQVVLCNNTQAGNMVESDAFKVFTFTGSDTVGWELKKRANRKKVILELGGTAPVIIEKSALNLQQIANEIVQSAFQFAGQVCISTQHVYIEKSLKETFLNLLNEALHKEWPVISTEASQRVAALVNDALSKGAVDLFNFSDSQQNGSNLLSPSVLLNVPTSHDLYQKEAFGPVLLVHDFDTIQSLITLLNESTYGLQTAVYTENQTFIKQLYQMLQTGALIVNNTPSFRLDNMPYGGIKNSGFGREGIAYAFEEMTEKKLLVW
jgi:acyl-CoA reductase-like NAD-dependent aldehyde dehydrogenase